MTLETRLPEDHGPKYVHDNSRHLRAPSNRPEKQRLGKFMTGCFPHACFCHSYRHILFNRNSQHLVRGILLLSRLLVLLLLLNHDLTAPRYRAANIDRSYKKFGEVAALTRSAKQTAGNHQGQLVINVLYRVSTETPSLDEQRIGGGEALLTLVFSMFRQDRERERDKAGGRDRRRISQSRVRTHVHATHSGRLCFPRNEDGLPRS